MAKSILIPLDFNQLEIQNVALQNLGSDPGSPVPGQVWFNTSTNYPKVYDGSADITLKGANHSLDEFAAPTSAVAMNSQEITGLSDPTDLQDAATKNYVDLNTSAWAIEDDGTQVLSSVAILDMAGTDFNVTTGADTNEAQVTLSNDSLTVAGNAVSLGGSTAVGFGDLSNVNLGTPSAGGLAIYDATNSEYVNAALTAGSGVSKTEADGSLTVSLTSDSVTVAGNSVSLGGSTTVAFGNMSNVNFGAFSQGEIPIYDSTNTEFVNAAITGGTGIDSTTGDGSATIALTNDSISLTGGNGISSIGSVSLGGSATIAIASDGVQTDEIDQSISPTWTGAHTFNGGIDAGGNAVTSVSTPSNGTDAANKNYVDSVEQGLEIKDSVEATSDGTNFDLTSSVSVTVDGITPSDGDRLLLKDQTTGTENGIYVASDATNPDYPSNWVRAADADEDSEVTDGMYAWTEQGTNNADTGYVLTTNDPTLGTDSLTFSEFTSAGEYLAGSGLSKSNKTFNIGTGNGLSTSNGTLNAALDKYTATIGDGAATSITVTHNLGTQDVEVAVRETASPYAFVDCQVEADDSNNVSLTFADAPGTDSYQAVVIG